MKGKGQGQGDKGSEKAVWNWQYVHGVDFWAGVLVRCGGGEMAALVYPLVQVSLGALGFLPSARAYPFHLHVLQSLIRLSGRTTYIPLGPYILSLLSGGAGKKEKGSTLPPLDLDTAIRCPAQYAGTRVYGDGIRREAVWLMAVWIAGEGVQGSVAFPEVAGSVVRVLRKGGGGVAIKGKKGGKAAAADTKVLIERIEASAAWVAARRAASLKLIPTRKDDVAVWQSNLVDALGESPLSKWVEVQRRMREREAERVKRARKGEGEVLRDAESDVDVGMEGSTDEE